MEEIFFEGEKYISTKRAAVITGYAKDYVGQLSRMGKIIARRVGRSWYVQEQSILEHKVAADVGEMEAQNNDNKSPIVLVSNDVLGEVEVDKSTASSLLVEQPEIQVTGRVVEGIKNAEEEFPIDRGIVHKMEYVEKITAPDVLDSREDNSLRASGLGDEHNITRARPGLYQENINSPDKVSILSAREEGHKASQNIPTRLVDGYDVITAPRTNGDIAATSPHILDVRDIDNEGTKVDATLDPVSNISKTHNNGVQDYPNSSLVGELKMTFDGLKKIEQEGEKETMISYQDSKKNHSSYKIIIAIAWVILFGIILYSNSFLLRVDYADEKAINSKFTIIPISNLILKSQK